MYEEERQYEVYADHLRTVADRFNRIQRLSREMEANYTQRKPKIIYSSPPRHRRPTFNRPPAETAAKNYEWMLLQNQARKREGPSFKPAKIGKHIHPCVCDLPPAHLRLIDETIESRKISRAELHRRIDRVQQFLRERQKEQISVKQQEEEEAKIKRAEQLRIEVEEKEEHETDGAESEHKPPPVREKKPKRRKRTPGVNKKIRKLVIRKIRKKKPPRRKSRTSMGQLHKLNWKKPPLIPIHRNKAAMLRESENSYCGRKPPVDMPVRQVLSPHVVHRMVRRQPKKVAENTRTSWLRLDAAPIKRQLITESQPKYKRPRFESCYRALRYKPNEW